MKRSIFRAFSIRGVVGESLSQESIFDLGRAAGTVFAGQVTTAAVGRDYRTSSPELASSLIKGLVSTGIEVIDIGACPTPMLNFAADYLHADAGFMVTASHNPARYNGLKIRTDHSLRGQELVALYDAIQNNQFNRGQGSVRHMDIAEAYCLAIMDTVEMQRPLRMVVDAGNGAAGLFAPRLIERLGCTVIPLYCEPDGTFPNRVPDPLAPGALDALSVQVRETKADAGLCYDGDGDRLAMVDEQGKIVFGDTLLTLLAQDALRVHPGATIAYELSCTQALVDTVRALGGQAAPSPVGYAFVHEIMRESGAVLGGESAGHLFFDDPGFNFDDAMLATAKMLSLLSRTNQPFSMLLAELPHYVLSPGYRFSCPDERKQDIVARVGARLSEQGIKFDDLDGVKAQFETGWALFRSSNTQPAVTLRYEARTQKDLEQIGQTMRTLIRNELQAVGVEMQNAH